MGVHRPSPPYLSISKSGFFPKPGCDLVVGKNPERPQDKLLTPFGQAEWALGESTQQLNASVCSSDAVALSPVLCPYNVRQGVLGAGDGDGGTFHCLVCGPETASSRFIAFGL